MFFLLLCMITLNSINPYRPTNSNAESLKSQGSSQFDNTGTYCDLSGQVRVKLGSLRNDRRGKFYCNSLDPEGKPWICSVVGEGGGGEGIYAIINPYRQTNKHPYICTHLIHTRMSICRLTARTCMEIGRLHSELEKG